MTRRRWTTPAAIAGLIALAAVIVVGVWQSRQPGSIPAVRLAQSCPVRLSDGVVITGAAAPGVPVVDTYEDPLCPACTALEDRIAPRLVPALTGGRITVRYQIINFLDPMSKPPATP